jgi:PKD repeat protein
MKKLFKISLILLIAPIFIIVAFWSTGYNTKVTYAADDWCAGWSNGIIKCPTEELSFKKYEGQLTTLSAEGYDPGLTKTTSVRDFIQKVVNYALSFLGLVAILLMIYAGVMYLTAGGQTEKTDKAKKTIGYTAIGLLLILGSYAIVNTVLTGPFEGGEQVAGDVQGWAATGFNAPTSAIINSTERVVEGYKFLYDSVETFKSLSDDSKKESLGGEDGDVTNKAFVLQYLSLVKSQIQNLAFKAPVFSKMTTKANEIMRYIDLQIDKISSNPYTEEGSLKIEWIAVRGELFGASANGHSLTGLLETIQEDFAGKKDQFASLGSQDPKTAMESLSCSPTDDKKPNGVMGDQICTLKSVYSDLSMIEVFKNTDIPTFYNNLLAKFAKLATDVWSITIDNTANIANSNQSLVALIQLEDSLVKSIKDIKFVQTKLIGNVVTGSAPLIVNFNVLSSVDPSGKSVDPKNIHWDLLGNGFDDESVQGGATNSDNECYSAYGGPSAEEKDANTFSNYCVYTKPGTYRASVRIDSSEKGKYASGISSLDIKVSPPKTLISLSVFPSSNQNHRKIMIDYDENGFLVESSDFFTVTKSEASSGSGVVFDASRTGNLGGQTGDTITNYRWDFGDGATIEQGKTKKTIQHQYSTEGVYTAILEVSKKDGDKSRKIFNVIVGSPTARIEIVPVSNKYMIGQTVSLDGSKSSTDAGMIKSYNWTVSYVETQEGKEVETQLATSNEKLIYFKFDKPGWYKFMLEVKDNLGGAATDTRQVKVESEPPVPIFEFSIPDKSQPSKIYFDASKTYDPDGDVKNINYEWNILPGQDEPGVVDLYNGTTKNSVSPIILFGKKGEYDVTLNVWDENKDKIKSLTKKIVIDNTLDITWASDQKVTNVLNDQGEAEMEFTFISNNGKAYEIDFGDGETATGEFSSKTMSVKHSYKVAGKFEVKITAYDEEDNDNTIKRKIFIGGGEKPVAKISFFVNGEEYIDFQEPVKVTRADTITFDASASKNTDGTGKDLKYSWDFGDKGNSSKKTVTHQYAELSPKATGYYTVKLKIFDKDDEGKTDEAVLKLDVIKVPPRFSSLQAIPQQGEDMVTPVHLNLQLFGARDPDGKITQFRWWYFDTQKPDEQLGIQITESPIAILVIGTKGAEGEEKTYGFGVELTDNDSNKISSEDVLEGNQIPKVTVKNGPNAIPAAKFSVDRTKVFVGEPVNFSSSSIDPDGKIIQYVWDFEGDGFFNNDPTALSTVSHVYNKKNLTGYKVKLKVVDDKYGEAVSEPITIFVDSNAKAPKAGFKYDVIGGKIVEFTNTSEADTSKEAKIESYKWDFDTSSQFETADSNGDGIKDNDTDSTEENPMFTYGDFGVYQVKLTVVDSQGNEDTVTKAVNVSSIGGSGGTDTGTTDTAGGVKPGTFGLGTNGTGGGTGTTGGGTGTTGGGQTGQGTGLEKEPGTGTGTSTGTGGTQQNQLKAVLITSPLPDADGVIRLPGTSGNVTFDFSQSVGNIAYYTFDKNIYFDTNKNGIPSDEEDFKTSLPGVWTTKFDKSWGKIVVKFVVTDIYGNTNVTVQEIAFK